MKCMDTPLSPQTRRALRARAHAMKPIVMISEQGLTPGVVAEIERGLQSHGLIKIRVAGHERDARDEMLAQVCSKTESHAIQHIGKILVIYRALPEPKPASATRRPALRLKKRASGSTKRTQRAKVANRLRT